MTLKTTGMSSMSLGLQYLSGFDVLSRKQPLQFGFPIVTSFSLLINNMFEIIISTFRKFNF